MNNDTFSYFPAETADPIGKYTQPKVYTVPLNKETFLEFITFESTLNKVESIKNRLSLV